jgi:hypothetical protein
VEFRVTVTVSQHGHDLENGERFLEGFVATHPETGPVVDQNTETGHLSITYSFEAEDFAEAARLGSDIFLEGATASGLQASDFVGAHIGPVPADELVDERELQPA